MVSVMVRVRASKLLGLGKCSVNLGSGLWL